MSIIDQIEPVNNDNQSAYYELKYLASVEEANNTANQYYGWYNPYGTSHHRKIRFSCDCVDS